MHHAAYDDEENATIADFMQHIKGLRQDVRFIMVNFAELSDAAAARLLEWLQKRGAHVEVREGRYEAYFAWLASEHERRDRDSDLGTRGVWELELTSNRLSSFELSGVTDMVHYNAALQSLELQGNQFPSGSMDRLDDIAAFARAIGTANVRTLNLTANMFGMRGIRTFFDALPRTGTTLQQLFLSVNTLDESAEDAILAAHSIARFLSSPDACRGLRRLALNGNEFGWHAVRAIVHAVIGSEAACDGAEYVGAKQPPNRSLQLLDLFSTGIDFMHVASHVSVPARVAWETSSRVTHTTWEPLVTRQLESNEYDAEQCVKSAAQVLAVARTVGCRVRGNAPRSDAFRFLQLPPELRALVLSFLDEACALSPLQFALVLGFACEPSTIGYGVYGHSPYAASGAATTELPLEPWCWADCFLTRSPPRDWTNERLNALHGAASSSNTFCAARLAFHECTCTDRAYGLALNVDCR